MNLIGNTRDIDGRQFYLGRLNPFETFDRVEITLSHLFRQRLAVLGNKNYSDCLWDYLLQHSLLRNDVIEIGCGIGDLASNLIDRSIEVGRPFSSYTMYDISPVLIQVQKDKLMGRVDQFVEADCLNLTDHIKSFSGLIVSNGMIADLRSVLLDDGATLENYGVEERDLNAFAMEWRREHGDCYVHIGTLMFVREIARCLESGAAAIITEYGATSLNQPSFFENPPSGFSFGGHFECGIDFDQVAAYARRLELEIDLVDIEEVLGLRRDQEFLAVDFFTSDRFAMSVPAFLKLCQGETPLPVLAYTRESLEIALREGVFHLSESETAELMKQLNGHFHSLHDPRFDHRNPTTWGYKVLVMKKPNMPEYHDLAKGFGKEVLSKSLNLAERETEEAWKAGVEMPRMGMVGDPATSFVVAAILGGVVYDCVKWYGRACWQYYVLDLFRARAQSAGIEENKLRLVALGIRDHFDWRD